MAFRLIRHGSQIGMHTLSFSREGDALIVDIDVEVLVKFGPIPVVRYTHHGRETWRGDKLVGLSANTDRNGTKLQVAAQRTSSGLAVEGSGTRSYIAPENALATTYWNPRMLQGPMIGVQDGMLVRPVVTPCAPEGLKVASGETIAAKRYQLSGDLDLELWYDASQTWAGMRFSVDDGSVVTYQRL